MTHLGSYIGATDKSGHGTTVIAIVPAASAAAN